MKPQATVKELAEHLSGLSVEDLNGLGALLANALAERETSAPLATSETPAASNGHKSHKRERGEWTEVKIINGHPYRYRRFWQGGKLRSKYLGKA